MLDCFKISFIFVLFYFPFLFLLLIPSNSIFLRPQDLHLEICTKLKLPFVCEPPSVTLAVIKPDGMSYVNAIMEIIEENGFQVIHDKTIQLSTQQVRQWYFDKQEASYYPSLVHYLTTRGPVRVLLLSRMDAIPALRRLIGPTNPDIARQSFPKSIRALYGTNIQENAIHASDSQESAKGEFNLFFGAAGDFTGSNTVAEESLIPIVTNTRHLE
jgi:nucleoside-diphosphate kinase